MFFSGLKRKVVEAREDLCKRLKNIRMALSQQGLDASLRRSLEDQEAKIKTHLETRIRKINGGF